jgi:hypothetical protein
MMAAVGFVWELFQWCCMIGLSFSQCIQQILYRGLMQLAEAAGCRQSADEQLFVVSPCAARHLQMEQRGM